MPKHVSHPNACCGVHAAGPRLCVALGSKGSIPNGGHSTTTEQQVGVDAVLHRDGRHRHAGLQAAYDQFLLELGAVFTPPPRRPYD